MLHSQQTSLAHSLFATAAVVAAVAAAVVTVAAAAHSLPPVGSAWLVSCHLRPMATYEAAANVRDEQEQEVEQ